jgi:hypothetical protein
MGRVSNLSAGGCRVASSVTLESGSPAVFTMYFHNGSLTLPGRVVAVGTKSLSVRFENLTPSLRYQLSECLESLNSDEVPPFRSGR